MTSKSGTVTVYTVDVVFSIAFTDPAEDIVGGDSITLVTVIATLFSAYNAPSEARTTMLYTLSPLASVGASKLGGVLKVTTPVEELILHNEASAPPKME